LKVFPIVKIESNSEFVLIHRLVSSLPKMSDELNVKFRQALSSAKQTDGVRDDAINVLFIFIHHTLVEKKKTK